MTACLIGLGANLQNPTHQILVAAQMLANHPNICDLQLSSLQQSKPIGGPPNQPPYVNAAALLQTDLAPLELLDTVQQVEQTLGREREIRWGQRLIDLDVLLLDNIEMVSPRLILPHPRMTFRRFVLQSAAEIAPNMVHPGTKTTLSQLRAHLDEPTQYVALSGGSAEQRTFFAEHLRDRHAALVISESNLPASPNEGRAIEFLQQRAKLLSPNNMVSDGQLHISNFYFDDLKHEITSSWQPDLKETWKQLCMQVVRPKLLAVICSEVSPTKLPTPWPCPIVQLPGEDPNWAVEELSAAILAMQ